MCAFSKGVRRSTAVFSVSLASIFSVTCASGSGQLTACLCQRRGKILWADHVPLFVKCGPHVLDMLPVGDVFGTPVVPLFKVVHLAFLNWRVHGAIVVRWMEHVELAG